MYNKIINLLLALLLTNASLALAETEQPNDYREPQAISDDEWQAINGKMQVYNSCLRQEMVKRAEKSNDPRVVSDQILDVCSSHLLELQTDMNNKNINPNFTERFIYTNKNRAARKMLGALMMMMAQKQQAVEATESNTAPASEQQTNQP